VTLPPDPRSLLAHAGGELVVEVPGILPLLKRSLQHNSQDVAAAAASCMFRLTCTPAADSLTDAKQGLFQALVKSVHHASDEVVWGASGGADESCQQPLAVLPVDHQRPERSPATLHPAGALSRLVSLEEGRAAISEQPGVLAALTTCLAHTQPQVRCPGRLCRPQPMPGCACCLQPPPPPGRQLHAVACRCATTAWMRC
jgi:hypothetical protein